MGHVGRLVMLLLVVVLLLQSLHGGRLPAQNARALSGMESSVAGAALLLLLLVVVLLLGVLPWSPLLLLLLGRLSGSAVAARLWVLTSGPRMPGVRLLWFRIPLRLLHAGNTVCLCARARLTRTTNAHFTGPSSAQDVVRFGQTAAKRGDGGRRERQHAKSTFLRSHARVKRLIRLEMRASSGERKLEKCLCRRF